MLSDLRSIESGLRLGQAISGPFAQAMIAKKQREQDLQDQDKSTQLKLALLAAEHPEYGLVQQPSAYDQDAGMRVGTPQAISDTEQSRLDAGGSYTPKKTDYQAIGDTGFSSSPSMASDYRRKERQQYMDDALTMAKEKHNIEMTGLTQLEQQKAQNRLAEIKEERDGSSKMQKDKLDVEERMLEKKLSGDGQSKLGIKLEESATKRWDKIVKDADPLSASSRNAFGSATIANQRANRAMDALNLPVVTVQDMGNISSDIAGIFKGGSPDKLGLSENSYNTLYSSMAGIMQKLTGKPQDAVPKEIVERMKQVVGTINQSNKAVINQQIRVIEKTHKDLLEDPDRKQQWEALKEELSGGVDSGDGSKKSSGADSFLKKHGF